MPLHPPQSVMFDRSFFHIHFKARNLSAAKIRSFFILSYSRSEKVVEIVRNIRFSPYLPPFSPSIKSQNLTNPRFCAFAI